MKLSELEDKSILILGFGLEGQDSYFALRKLFPNKVLAIADQSLSFNFKRSNLLKLHLGKDYLKALKKYQVIIKTPGISLNKIKPYLKKGQKITSQTEIFFDNCPGKIIAITGSKGKGTTASLIYHILNKAGLKAKLVGNIEKPVFQTLLKAKKNDVFVYEISAQQLQILKKSPQIAVFLNLFPAHLDFFKSFRDYKKAKENIALHQTKNDYFIYNSEDKNLKELAKKTKARKIPIRGKYNQINIAAASKVGELLKIPKGKIKQAIKIFKPLEHRMEFVGEFKDIKFYNDSLATLPEATIAGIESFNNKVETIILGGLEIPKINFSGLAKKIVKSQIKNLVFLPGNRGKIIKEIKKRSKKLPKIFFVQSMEQAVKTAYQNMPQGGVCLLSPTAPSFNLFKDYKDRGNQFKKFVRKFSKLKDGKNK